MVPVVVVIAFGVVAGLGCFGQSEAERAVAEAEEMAEAALLSEEDLPEEYWILFDGDTGRFADVLSDAVEADPRRLIDCETGSESAEVPQTPDHVVGLRERSFMALGENQIVGITLVVMIYETEDQLTEASGEFARGEGELACVISLMAAPPPRVQEVRDEAPHYGLPGAYSSRLQGTAYDREYATEVHSFIRGRVFASYMLWGDRTVWETDHQALLEAFEARVAAHGGG